MTSGHCIPVTLSRGALAILGACFLAFACAPAPVEPADSGTQPGSGGANGPGSGGAIGSSGGAPGSGGASNSGGAPGSGGATGSGGAQNSGGATGSGGRGTGGARTGGSTGTGGRGTGGSGTGGRGTGGGGTATGGSSGGGATGTFSAVATMLGTSCGTGTCHQGGDHVDLRNNAGLYGRLVGAMPAGTGVMANCKTMTLVVANTPASSVLSQIVKARVSACGARMPDNCSTTSANPRACLTTAQIATIDAWISAGAPM